MKILLGLSGGVDSAYAASKLQSLGHIVEGCVLVMHEYTDTDAARRAAGELCIPLHVVDCRQDFEKNVKADLVREYSLGRTPNPCIVCNELVKFASLYSYAMDHGFDMIATGHYANVTYAEFNGQHRYAVTRAQDLSKDQSYMLYRLSQDILSHLLLPLGDTVKSDVRFEASKIGLSAANSRDSQEICFLPNGNHSEYVESIAGKSREGFFIDSEGNILGTHKGIVRYTVGQRKGLGIALGRRMFVTAIDPIDNTVTLSPEITGKKLVRIDGLYYQGLTPVETTTRLRLSVKVRYSAKTEEAECEIFPDGTALLSFDREVSTAPGQSAVLYSGERVMLGGFIC